VDHARGRGDGEARDPSNGRQEPEHHLRDADLPAAVRGAQNGIFYGKGRGLRGGIAAPRGAGGARSGRRAARGAGQEAHPGDPFDKNTRLGAIVSKRQQETVLSYIAAGEKEGARLVAGGKPAKVNGKGYYVEATVFDGAKPGMKIVDEEIFRPVLSVLTFANEAEGIQLANRSMYASLLGSGPRTSRRRTAWPAPSRRAPSGSTRTTSTIRRPRLAATSSPGSAEIWGKGIAELHRNEDGLGRPVNEAYICAALRTPWGSTRGRWRVCVRMISRPFRSERSSSAPVSTPGPSMT